MFVHLFEPWYGDTVCMSSIGPLTEEPGAIEVGFRPSGELHLGNLVSITAAGLLAASEDRTLQVTCCDTDWDAHTHQLVEEQNSRTMRHYFSREDPDGCHDSLAKHRSAMARPYIEAIGTALDISIEYRFMSDLQKEQGFRDALARLLERMDAFDAVWDGGFRRRWVSPVSPVCDCGFGPAKGASYGADSRTLTFPCWHDDCSDGFHEARLDADNELGIYYLVDPIRDTANRDTAIHVFGGDYRKAEKGQKTTKLHKVASITEIANGETPTYWTAPLIVDTDGKPLSKSKGTGKRLSAVGDPEAVVPSVRDTVETAVADGKDAIVESALY